MRLNHALCAAAAALLIATAGSQAAELKIACVNMETLFQKFYKTKVADEKLNSQKQIYKEYAQNLHKEREALEKELKEHLEAAQNIVLSEAVRDESRRKAETVKNLLREKAREIQQYSSDKQRELQQKYEAQRTELVTEIQKVITSIAVEAGDDLVLDVSGSTLNRMPTTVYFKPELDITETVLGKLNAGHDAETPAPTPTEE